MTDQHLSLGAIRERLASIVAEAKSLKEQEKNIRHHGKEAVIAEIKAILARNPDIKITATELGIVKWKKSGKPKKARKVYYDPLKDRTWSEGSRAMPKWVSAAAPGSLVITVTGDLESEPPEIQGDTSVEAV